MPTYRPTMTALVAGLPTTITEAHTHDAANEIDTCTLVLALPAPEHVEPNAVVEVVATMTNVATGASESATIFQGQCRGPVRDVLTIAGATKTLQAQGWLALMDLPHHEDVAFAGPIAASAVVRGLFEDRAFGVAGRPTFRVDDILTPAGAAVTLGGEPLSDDGQVRVPAGRSESYFGFVARLCRLFGYAVYGNAGAPRVSRIFGTPTGTSVKTFTEGTESFEWEGAVDLHDVVTWWEVLGASWRDEDGTETAIRSFPASVPASDDIPDPPSATRGDEADSLLVTQTLADAVRNVREIEFGVRRQLVRWSVRGQPLIRPGQVVTLSAPTVGVSGDVWVYSVDHDYTADGGYVTRISGSFGGGEALPAGSDVCETVALSSVTGATVRFYLQNAAPGYTPSVARGAWDDAGGTTATKLGTAKAGAVALVSRAETNAGTAWDVLVLRAITDALPAQTVSGTVDLCTAVAQTSNDAELSWHVHIWATVGDSDTVRGTLLSDRVENVATDEWPVLTALGNRFAAPVAVSPVALQDGDRIVVELGYRAHNALTVSRSGEIRYGGTSGTDSTDGAGATAPGWVEFSSVVAPGGGSAVTMWHVGDEVVPWYAIPAADGTTITVAFTPLDDYTSITLTGRHHGTNSQFIDSQNTDLTVSRFQLWQGGVQIGEGAMPVADENYALQLDYTNDANWSDFAVPIPGTLEGGVAAELRIISGKNPALPSATDDDDFEVKNIVLTSCAQGSPTLPTEPTSPTIPPAQPPAPTPTCWYESAGGSASFGVSPVLLAAPWLWPEGYQFLRISGTASGLTGDLFGGHPVQSIYLSTAGGAHGLWVPGTQDAGGLNGTLLTGGGAFEVWHALGAPAAAGLVITGSVTARTHDGTTAPPPFAVSGLCFFFTNDAS